MSVDTPQLEVKHNVSLLKCWVHIVTVKGGTP